MAKPERPLLILAAPRTSTYQAGPRIGNGPRNPKKARQVQRLEPKFETLEEALAARHAALQAVPTGVPPEQVLVLETNGAVTDFNAIVARTPGLEWLADDELRDLDPDEDFFFKKDPEKKVTAVVYLIMSNQEALGQLLSAWRLWKAGRRMPPALRGWPAAFAQLRDIRRWGPQDRVRETGILEAWKERVKLGGETVAVEIELWFRRPEEREGALQRLRGYVQRARGQWVSTSLIEPIAYHAVLARLPIEAVDKILADHEEVELLQCDDVRLFRAVGQASVPVEEEELEGAREATLHPRPAGDPVVALLDGLPIENHLQLRNRLIVDDPDGWSATYPVSSRGHGTAMASLILRGDLGAEAAPGDRPIYVRPILRPDSFDGKREAAPEDVLWPDLVHRAVRRIVEGDGEEPAVAPTVRVINLSVGDPYQPFLHTMSPMAKLLDWLSWTYKVLFIVSAGNHHRPLSITAGDTLTEDAVLKQITDDHRNRRLLSPAESVNAITVGATPDDLAGEWSPRAPEDTLLVTTDGLPSLVSALGRGYRRAVKPDLLLPGGRVVLTSEVPGVHDVAVRPRLPPGQKVAAPGRLGELTGARFTFGTSNAAALASGLAVTIHDALADLRDEPNAEELAKVSPALWLKTLLVHGASWTPEALDVATRAIRNDRNALVRGDEVTAILGYGKPKVGRVLACAPERATMLAGGTVRAGVTNRHVLPLPASLNAHAAWRRLTITLAWFTPVHPGSQKYRVASLFFEPPSKQGSPLRVTRTDADWRAARRGTVQHEVLAAERGAINIGLDAELEIPVTCVADARSFEEPIEYAMAVTVEVAAGVNTRIYEEVRERVRPRVPVQPGRV